MNKELIVENQKKLSDNQQTILNKISELGRMVSQNQEQLALLIGGKEHVQIKYWKEKNERRRKNKKRNS